MNESLAPHQDMDVTCLSCRKTSVRSLVDFGPQPPSNRFERADVRSDEKHPLIVGQCSSCGLAQLVDPMATDMVVPRFEWLTYNEPEGHLDDLVDRLCRLCELGRGARIAGLTYKDDSTLHRCNRLGYANTYRYDAQLDFGLARASLGLESVQRALDSATLPRLVTKHGTAHLLIVRHMLEHARDPVALLGTLSQLVRPGGYLVFEVPDCTKFMNACDYSFIWEEHITYFSAPTLAALVGNAGLDLVDTLTHSYPLEDSLIGIVRNRVPADGFGRAPADSASSIAAGETFARRFAETRARLHCALAAWRAEGKRIALFGAGHLAAKFVNFYGLSELIECVLDDHPEKQRLLMPGSRLPIRSSAALEDMDVCLLAVSPESEQKVLDKHRSFLAKGGQVFSIFALNPRSVYAAQAT